MRQLSTVCAPRKHTSRIGRFSSIASSTAINGAKSLSHAPSRNDMQYSLTFHQELSRTRRNEACILPGSWSNRLRPMHSPITPTTSAPPASAREELPAKSRVFCMAPWVGLNLNPSGDVYPCCYYVHENPVGRLADSSVEAIRNSTAIKELRKNMLAGEPSPGCRKCYAAEAMGSDTARTHMNKTFSGLPEAEALLASTAPDGSLTREEILFLDVQFSNVCN